MQKNLGLIAARIFVRLHTDSEYLAECQASNEYYRCAISSSPYYSEPGELDTNPLKVVDGSVDYATVVNLLEALETNGKYL
jgi:hypothetical protein